MGVLFLPGVEDGLTDAELPAEVVCRVPESACRMAYAICFSENFHRFIGPLLSLRIAEAAIVLQFQPVVFFGETSLQRFPAICNSLKTRRSLTDRPFLRQGASTRQSLGFFSDNLPQICRSNEKSVTWRLNLGFSSRSCRNSNSSFRPSPAYFRFHRQNACSLTLARDEFPG